MMFSAFQTFGKLGALASSVARAWSPLALWPNGIASPGMWISPRTLTSQWQDYLGTTPVAVPGSVADSTNPVGLALDIRAGAPTPLGPELVVNGDGSSTTGWLLDDATGTISSVSGRLRFTSAETTNSGILQTLTGLTVGTAYQYDVTLVTLSNPSTYIYLPAGAGFPGGGGFNTIQTYSFIFVANATSFDLVVRFAGGAEVAGNYFEIDNVSVREIPGHHMLQATSAARPLESAYDGQTLGPGNTYDARGYPVFQLYDGVDDGMATASFAAGTLINGMDCMIAVRRDSGANAMLGMYVNQFSGGTWFGVAESGSASVCHSLSGAPTVWVDNVQLTGGTAVARETLHTALTVEAWHILEFRGLDLSAWTAAGFGGYTDYRVNGARGDIMLYPSTASTADKDAARQYLADKYGVTLP